MMKISSEQYETFEKIVKQAQKNREKKGFRPQLTNRIMARIHELESEKIFFSSFFVSSLWRFTPLIALFILLLTLNLSYISGRIFDVILAFYISSPALSSFLEFLLF